jgi:UV DNA damage endonuclease
MEDVKSPKDLKVILGLCCINTHLQATCNVRARIIQRSRYTVEDAIEKAIANLEDLSRIIDENIKHKMYSFRMSSDLLPRYTDTQTEFYDMAQFQDLFDEIRDKAEDSGYMGEPMRLTFHPGQFVVLASEDPTVIDSSIRGIEYHCEILERIGASPSLGVCNIHVGGLYEPKYKCCHDLDYKTKCRADCKEKVIERWCNNYHKLSDRAKRYLTIENDEKIFNVDDCLKISDLCKIPVVYDTHHEECYIKAHPGEIHKEIDLERLVKSWTNVGRAPLAHISNQDPDKRVGAHSEFITRVPEIVYRYAEMCPNKTLWLDVEAKAKEQAVYGMRANFPNMY